MTFIDLFAGTGGFRRGMELAGHKCIGFCEWDKFDVKSLTVSSVIYWNTLKRIDDPLFLCLQIHLG